MGMPIEDSIENLVLLKKIEDYLGNISGNTNSVESQTYGCAIETMRKYQKIEEIVGNYGFDTSWLCLKKIREVIEDGNDD